MVIIDVTKKTTPEGDIVPRGDSITSCLAEPRQSDANFTYDVRDHVSEITGNDFHYKYSYGNVQGALDPYWNSLLVKEADVNRGIWTEHANGYYGLPWETFDSFGWNKVTRFNFSNTPVGYTPSSIYYNKRYVSASSGGGMQIGYTYDNALRVTKKNNYVFHSEVNNAFDANGMLSSIYYHPQSGYPSNYYPSGRLNFTRDGSGLIKEISQDLGLKAFYNPDLEITQVQHTVPQLFDEAYTYDSNGNRLTSLTNSYTYDNLNRLTASTINDYTYDADGNMTMEKNKLTSETKKYYYDSENRMVKYEHLASDISPVDSMAEYKYDIFGRRIQKSVNGIITNFMWEGDNLSFELNASNQPIRKYFTETGMDDYLGHIEYSEVTNWQRLFEDTYPQGWYSYIKDQVGTIYKVWDQNAKQIVDNRTYDSFGNLINQTGTTKTPLGFQGKYYDQESGLNYFYHRYYNPAIGRFINEDPVGLEGGLNLFNFVGGNPVKFTDKFGLESDWRSEMPNGGGWSQVNNNEFNAFFGASPSEIIGWTIKGTWNDLKDFNWCCYSKCMLKKNLPALNRKISMSFHLWMTEHFLTIAKESLEQLKWVSKKFSIIFYASIIKSGWDCYLECR